MRASPLSSAAIAASTAWRTSPLVADPIASRSSQARSITACRSVAIVFPQNRFQPFADIGDADVDDGIVIAVTATLGAIVHPYRRQAERLGRREVAHHVLDHDGLRRLDPALVEQLPA